MKYHRLPEIMVRTVRHCRFGKEKMRELPCHDSEMIALTPDLLDSRQALECLAIRIMLLDRCRLKLSAKLSMHSIEQILSGYIDFVEVPWNLIIPVRDEIDIVIMSNSKPRSCI
jgi:hypothetical protein